MLMGEQQLRVLFMIKVQGQNAHTHTSAHFKTIQYQGSETHKMQDDRRTLMHPQSISLVSPATTQGIANSYFQEICDIYNLQDL